jgi:hypothetical protein
MDSDELMDVLVTALKAEFRSKRRVS